ncbi:tungsten ABC transporter TupABC, periplasmic tungstate-binding protein [Campylobacter blaseri]|uniref:Tungsten ABC transporter substrate-binding protein n=1 Tax=Campylobacter blaseri TaxID=2042961 RepID=A0A2P8QZ27_9BACT|nr:tungstate ABC transporter substrate-binding protein TupA [Campylobacter blaseri]PSM51504.1 tungsten ABC transporter substrate-binding protein [Campylobacter blaseri]PSM52953.1 tungsten ABC transporter substrate-binding protein [Campylobacter blaseri]QKF86485.1 tungsten ABC transporter TupABC, periplasmic tungstate-binding protein [Campylobacter blaseri]
MKKHILMTILSLAVAFSLNAKDTDLVMATTTSTDNTGLLDDIYPVYKKATGVDIKWTAVGTGKALEMGKNCDADILFVHSPAVEKKFVDEGYGIDRTPVMYNDFILIGHKSLADKFKNKSLKETFQIIENEKIKFFSRGDKSGTNNKEIAVWKAAIGQAPEKESWYNQTGQGMISTINIAAEQKGVTLTDRGTFIKYEHGLGGKSDFEIISEGDANLKNFYSVIAVNPKNCEKADYENATEFINWITSDDGQKFIEDFKLMGKPLFTPDAKTRKES